MKRFVGIGSMILMLALAAAQCGAASESATTQESNQAAETSSQVSVEESAAKGNEEANVAAEAEVSNAVEQEVIENRAEGNEEVVGEPGEIAKPEAAESEAGQEAAANDHSEACADPFEGVSLRFSPDVWNAEGLARFAGSELVDPASGLETNFCKHSVNYGEILSGGPPPDGIPPLDNPNFDPIAQGDEWLADVQPVIALVVGDQARAYPLAILTRHEIANDEIAGLPVAVTFCPLCNAAIVFKREVDGEVLRFGVSGNLRNSDLIMWDNKTLSWWQQFTGEAIVGDLTGTQLEMIPAQLVSWQDFKAAYPNGTVLSNNGRSYGQNPYAGYDSSPRPFLFTDTPDPRLPATERVLGYFSGDTAVAYPLPVIVELGVIEDNIDGQDVVIFYEPGQVSALDQSIIADSKEVGSAGMFRPEVGGQKLTFSYEEGVITDNETGSEWDVFGRAIEGELAGAQLQPILSHTHFWFAWAAFRPDTRVYGS